LIKDYPHITRQIKRPSEEKLNVKIKVDENPFGIPDRPAYVPVMVCKPRGFARDGYVLAKATLLHTEGFAHTQALFER
jgi:hypothetical protein